MTKAVNIPASSDIMARKGGQNKNGPNLASPNRHNTDSRSVNGDKLKTQERDAVDDENPNSHSKCISNGSGENSNQKTRSNKRNSHRNSDISSIGKSDDKASDNQQSMDTHCDTGNPAEKELLSSTTEIRRDSEKSSQRDCNKDSSMEQTSVSMLAENVLEKTRCLACMAALILRASMMYVMEESKRFAERQKPTITTFMTVVHKGHTYVRCKIEYAYPIVRTWMFNAGKLMLLLLMVWLDCNIRGFDSLLRLGTTSSFAVLWCSILSISAMIGIKKMVIFMVIAASVVAFIGLGFAILIISVCAMVILWLYGSFWTTSLVIILGGASFFLNHERFALLVTTLYSMYCARSYVGWFGLLLSLNLSFISSDALVHFLKNNVDDNKFNGSSKNSEQTQGRSGNFFGEFHSSSTDSASQSGYGRPTDRGPGDPSTSGAEKEVTSEDEVVRLLNCTDHYSALGFRRYENIDVSLLKREYKKKAMLVHPDKNMGNEKAADAFKKLQNACEVLLDSLKRKTYDDELRREELLNYFRRFQSASQKKGRNGTFRPGFSPSDVDEGPYGLSRQIACKKCGDFHLWIYTGRAKSQARWCQDCKEFHQAKDGDGWVEQSFQPLLFGLLHKTDLPRAYVCAESRIFDVTEWFSCQGMRCPMNTHKPSFHVNTSLGKQSSAKGSTPTHRGAGVPNSTNMDEAINEEEFFEWLQNAVQSGMFETFGAQSDPPSPGSGSNSRSSGKKKRKGKKQW